MMRIRNIVVAAMVTAVAGSVLPAQAQEGAGFDRAKQKMRDAADRARDAGRDVRDAAKEAAGEAAVRAEELARRARAHAAEWLAQADFPRDMYVDREARKEKGTFLGLTGSPANATVREQLKLPRGMGLVVDFVVKDSPAEQAGIRQHDILTRLDDQWLVNIQQLSVLVRNKKPGETVKLTYVRAGETGTAEAKLVEGDVPVMEDAGPWLAPPPQDPRRLSPRMPPGGWTPGGRVTARTADDGSTVRTLTDASGTLTLTETPDGKATLVATDRAGNQVYSGPADDEKKLPADVAERLKTLRDRTTNKGRGALPGAPEPAPRALGNDAAGNVTASMARADGQHTIRLEIRNGDRRLTVTDNAGKEIFDGPINTPDERSKVPAEISRKLEGLEGRLGQ